MIFKFNEKKNGKITNLITQMSHIAKINLFQGFCVYFICNFKCIKIATASAVKILYGICPFPTVPPLSDLELTLPIIDTATFLNFLSMSIYMDDKDCY